MKTLLFAAPLLTLAACSGSSNCDTGDTACGVGDDAPLLQFVDGNCAGGSCIWYAEYSGEGGQIELDLAETGDPSSTCGPSSTKGLNECGFWTEYHTAFSLTSSTSDYEAKQIDLNLITDWEAQTQDVSTLFDVSDGTISNQLTVMFTLYDGNGDYADCVVYGHDITWFEDWCTITW